jgi:hypothetical protein
MGDISQVQSATIEFDFLRFILNSCRRSGGEEVAVAVTFFIY